MITDEMVEAAAKAAYESVQDDRGEYAAVTWDQIHGGHREGWFKIARAVLAVAFASNQESGDGNADAS